MHYIRYGKKIIIKLCSFLSIVESFQLLFIHINEWVNYKYECFCFIKNESYCFRCWEFRLIIFQMYFRTWNILRRLMMNNWVLSTYCYGHFILVIIWASYFLPIKYVILIIEIIESWKHAPKYAQIIFVF